MTNLVPSTKHRNSRGVVSWQMTWVLERLFSTAHLRSSNNRIISLLVADPKDSNITPVPFPEEASGTLIVAPVSLISNWTNQIQAHLLSSTLSVTVLHNSKKQDANVDLSAFDVVITSYSTLVSAYKKEGFDENAGKKVAKTTRGVFGRLWRRIVLDEGHTIRNPMAKVSLAVTHLDAVSRWSITGNMPLMKYRIDDRYTDYKQPPRFVCPAEVLAFQWWLFGAINLQFIDNQTS